MTPKELKSLVKTMRSLGVTHFKDAAIELNLTPEAPVKAQRHQKVSTEEEKEIKHKIEAMTSIMQLDDKELLDRLFPDTMEYPDDDQVENLDGLHS